MIPVTIAPGHWLDTAPAASYLRMLVAGCPAGITDAGRTAAEQIRLFTDRYTTNYYLSAKTIRAVWAGNVWWLKPGRATAAVPGTSKHETGTALDLPAAAAAWVRAHGAAYGWIADKVKREWWHMEYVATRDTHTTASTPAQPVPVPAPLTPLHQSEEDDMTRFIELLYLAYLNRAGSAYDVLALAGQAQAQGWSLAQLEVAFMSNHAEAGTVVAAFRHWIGHDPNAEQIAVWSDTETIAQVWAGVGGSPEAIARRG